MAFTIKQTKWIEKKIGDGCIVGDGAHAKIKRQRSGVLYLTCKNFKNGGLDLSKLDYISEEDYQKYFRENSKALTKVKADDVLFSIIGTIGEPYLVNSQDRFGISSSVSILRPDTTVLYPKYVYYWIKGHIFQNALYGIKGGVAQGYVSLEMIKTLPLHYPPLPIQRKIAAILSAYDRLIENNTRRIEILEEMARSIYREWFVKFRFPGHEQVQMVDSELGLIPEGWEVKNFGEVSLNFDSKRKPLSSIQRTEMKGEYPYYGASGIIDYVENYILDGKYLLISEDGENLNSRKKPIAFFAYKKFWVNNHAHIVQGKPPISTEFLYLLISDLNIAGYITGAAQPKFSQANLNRIPLVVPTDDLLKLFNQIAENLLNQMEILGRKNANLRKTRDLLLPRLISGEIDVENLDINTGEIAA